MKINKKAIRTIGLIVVFPIITLRLLGLLQPLEWTAYDLLFYFSASEPRDERIVLITWDEQDLQTTKEITLSDQKLVSVLEKIKEQKPRLIGLDLYRDIPVLSRLLEKKQNEQAYARLQEILRSTPNLMGIEKVGEPTIAPPLVLKEEGRVFASDIITDTDNIVRRTYIAKQPLEKEDAPTSYKTVLYLGINLGAEYLVEEGFSYKNNERGSLILYKGQSEITLDNLKTFDGGYINNRSHLDFLINWPRGDDLFETVSVRELLRGEIPPDLVRDKIVLIGNVASSTADRHILPITRWNYEQSWTYGLYIPAYVASSIISAALDGRPLIKVAPWGSGYLLFAISIASIAYVIFKYSHFRPQKLYFVSALFSLGLTVLIGLGSLLAFQFGWWIPIVPAVLGSWLTFIAINNHVQIVKEQENVLKLKLIADDLNHQIGNSSNLVKLNTRNLKSQSHELYQILLREHQEEQAVGAVAPNMCLEETEKGQALTAIGEEVAEIDQQLKLIKKYKQRTTQFIEVTCSRKKPERQLTNVNEFVRQIVAEVTKVKQEKHKHQIWVEEVYDPNLKPIKIDRLSLEIILDNLIDNAFEAVDAQLDREPNYRPTVKIETNKSNNGIALSVQDNGIGISQKHQRVIFQPYVSFKVNKGQGIGLNLVKKLVQLDRGNIKVESELRKGSKFIIILPRKF